MDTFQVVEILATTEKNTLIENQSKAIAKQKRYNRHREDMTAVNLNKTCGWFMKKLSIGKKIISVILATS